MSRVRQETEMADTDSDEEGPRVCACYRKSSKMGKRILNDRKKAKAAKKAAGIRRKSKYYPGGGPVSTWTSDQRREERNRMARENRKRKREFLSRQGWNPTR